jgi:hypothetical protein
VCGMRDGLCDFLGGMNGVEVKGRGRH